MHDNELFLIIMITTQERGKQSLAPAAISASFFKPIKKEMFTELILI
jgi:hypothetical protein